MKEVTTHQHDMITFLFYFSTKKENIFLLLYDDAMTERKEKISNLKR